MLKTALALVNRPGPFFCDKTHKTYDPPPYPPRSYAKIERQFRVCSIKIMLCKTNVKS
jgi:hypothetical protein